MSLFGLTGFWNRSKRNKIIKMVEESLPEDYFISKIGWSYCTQTYNNVWKVYVEISRTRKESCQYYPLRQLEEIRFDLDKNISNIFWEDK